MKIRTGFVSNSSSSSFMMVIPKDVWDQLISEATPYEAHTVRQMFRDSKFNGEPVKFYNGEIGTDCDSWVMENDDHEEEPGNIERRDLYDMRVNAFNRFCDKAEREYKDKVLAHCC
jgi:hypothetical protein